MKLRPPAWAVIYLVVAVGVGWVTRPWIAMRIVSPMAGAICVAAGFGFIMWASVLFHRHQTTIRPGQIPSAIVTAGPYRFTRNPMYVGIASLLLGIVFLFGDLPAFLAPVAFLVTMDRLIIPQEERNLEQAFGHAYLDFKRRVRRWL